MRIKSVRKLLEQEAERLPYWWWDDELDMDGINASEWAFSQGYYAESEAS